MIILNIEGIPDSCADCRFYRYSQCCASSKYYPAAPKPDDCPILGEIPAVMTYTLSDDVDVDSFMKGVDWVFSYIEEDE